MEDIDSKELQFNELPCEDHDSGSGNSRSVGEGEWLIHVKQGIHAQNFIGRPSTVCIFSVPKILIDLKGDAYLPQAVSIGPSYHRNRDLSDMDNHKLRAAQRMMKRLQGGTTTTDINSLVAVIKKMDAEIRDSYEKVIDCNSETLAWMMLLDASFLLELLRTLTGKYRFDSSDCMYFEPLFDENRIKSVGFAVLGDIVKLENQIPLFVLTKILEFETGSVKEAQTRLFRLLFDAASTFFPFKYLQISRYELYSPFIGREHFLGFLHGLILSFFSGPRPPLSSSSSTVQTQNLLNHVLPSVSRLSKAGIMTRPFTGDLRMALRFEKETSTLFLPVIIIKENTETVLRNLMALEAFLPSELQVISCYVGLMKSLIYSEQDATLLRMAGVFYIYVGNDAQVAELWESLCKGMAISSLERLKILKREIIECYRSKWRARLLEFVFTRFTRPRRMLVSLLVAFFIFLFTFAQALSSMYGLFKGSP